MRPTALESLRAIQAALAEVIAPELSSAFAQDAAQTVQMLLESVAAEWDTASEHLRQDNEVLVELLGASSDAMRSASRGNETFRSLVSQIEQRPGEDASGSISHSTLAAHNNALRAILEQVLMAFEDISGQAEFASTDPIRARIYAHLRDVATRGWSFWDVSSFRGRIATIRSATARDDAPPARGVE